MQQVTQQKLKESLARIPYIYFPMVRLQGGHVEKAHYLKITGRYLVPKDDGTNEENMFDIDCTLEDGTPLGRCRIILEHSATVNKYVRYYVEQNMPMTVITYDDMFLDPEYTDWDMYAKQGVYQDQGKHTKIAGILYAMINGQDMGTTEEIPF